MDLRVNVKEFLTELAPMQGIVERKTTIPVLSHLLLESRDGKLHISSTDLDVSLTSWCQAEIREDGAIAVPARKFMDIIRSLVGDQVHLSMDDPEWLGIEAASSRFKIHGMRPDDFPTLPEVDDRYEVELPFERFRAMIGKVLFAVSAEESRFQLNGALLKLKPDALEMVASDGHRLALVETDLDTETQEDSVLVARKALQEIQRFESAGDIGFRRGEHHLSFRLGRRNLICRILEGTFPDYERVIARDNEHKAVFDRKELDAAVQRVALLTGDRARAVRFEFVEDQLIVSAANPDLGEAREEVPCDYPGDELHLGMNPDYVRDFLAVVETDRVRLELQDENTQCVAFPAGDDSEEQRHLCVIMPMRV